MTLRKKTLVIVGLLIASLLVTLYIASQVILLPGLGELEAQEIRYGLDIALNSLEDELENLNSTAENWAAWDDTYGFVQGSNPGYPLAGDSKGVFLNLQLNLLLLLDSSGQIIFAEAFDIINQQRLPLPDGLQARLSPDSVLLGHSDPRSSLTGVLVLSEESLLIASRPIVTSDHKGPIAGTLVMGRFLDGRIVKELSDTVNLGITTYAYDAPQLPSDFQMARSALETETSRFAHPIDNNIIAGYAFLDDIYGQPGLLLRTEMPRMLYEQGQNTIFFFTVALLITSVILGFGSLLLLEWQVLSRITALSVDVGRIGATGKLARRLRLPGRDELAKLAHGINDMLDRLSQAQAETRAERDRTELLYEASSRLGAKLDYESIMTTAAGLSERLGASAGEIYLLMNTDEIYFKSSIPGRNEMKDAERYPLVRRLLTTGVAGWVLKTGAPALMQDIAGDDRWESFVSSDQQGPLATARSAMCAPIQVGQERIKGAILFTHSAPDYFKEQDLVLLKAVVSQITTSLENTSLLIDIQSSLHETHLMLDISRQLSGALELDDVYTALIQSVMATGADRCVLYVCEEPESDNLPHGSESVLVGDLDPVKRSEGIGHRFSLDRYPTLMDTIRSQETLVITDLENEEGLEPEERTFLQSYDTRSIVINPLVNRGQVIGLISINYRTKYFFSERELALYRTLGNQTTIAIENARQVQRTERALAETQTLYRAGRVLAGAADIYELLEEALVEFLYSLNVYQGAITLLTPDKNYGQLMAYMQDGQIQEIERLRFPISKDIPYQEILLSGQPFVSQDAANDPRLVDFLSFNEEVRPRALLEAPMIIQGETIGWIGADAIEEGREWTQSEIDLARAMADQIAITIQNRRLLEQTERRAERLKAVAKVGETVSGLIDLNEIFGSTVELIKERFGLYNVSIFLLDDAREWAILRASAGQAAEEMMANAYRLKIGSDVPVSLVAAKGKPCLVLDVGENPFHFNYRLLPDTRSEIAVPLLSRGLAIGALDVQSVDISAFSDEDVETLQIMADQLATAIENARLFDQIQRRLIEQATLYRIGTKVGATLDLQESADSLVIETAEALDAGRCALILVREEQGHIISDYVAPESPFERRQGESFDLQASAALSRILSTKQEAIFHIDTPGAEGMELEYLKAHQGTALAVIPVLLRNEVIAFLEVYDNKPGRRFKREDIALLDSIALQAANGIENAGLFASAQESQAFMKAIIDQIPDPISIKDRNHRWVVVNQALANLMGLAENDLIGRTDYDYSSKEEADWFWEQDNLVFETGQIQETEEQHTNVAGKVRILYTRKIPLYVSEGSKEPEYLVGIINDITERKQRELERERLIEETRQTLERTQTLYRISDVLAATTEQQATFELVLAEYLKLLNLDQGAILLFDESSHSHKVEALHLSGQAADPRLLDTADLGFVAERIVQKQEVQVFEDLNILAIPLITRGKTVGAIMIDAAGRSYVFSESNIEVGEAIAGQLTMWLENRQLLAEMQHRSNLMRTASEVSRAASSILDSDELIKTSVNLIRDQFDFYYVGLFLVNEAKDWAVLTAGTGEAGQQQLARGHRLEIGGESMIGWSVANRKARIALDVGQEAVRFQNPFLPDTHSEMALPLISRDEVIGALTVQSTRRGAFSEEDITVLQTMADQQANAIENARLFAQTQQSLAEAEMLYQVTQELLSAHDEVSVYQVATEAIAQTDVDTTAIYIYTTDPETGESLLEQKAVWIASGGEPAFANGVRFKAEEVLDEQLVPRYGPTIIEDVAGDPRLTDLLRQVFMSRNITTVLVLPLSTPQARLGFLIITYRDVTSSFNRQQIRFYNTIVQQMVIALENLRFLAASQRRARREEIIREISNKIRSSISMDDIMKTTVTELSKVLGTSRGSITLNTRTSSDSPEDNRMRSQQKNGQDSKER